MLTSAADDNVSELKPAERRSLRARAHHLQPVVMVGEAGVTPQVMREIDASLRAHELIKIRVLGEDRTVRAGLVSSICGQAGAHAIQQIGKVLVIYRPRRPEDRAAARQRPRRKPARKTKRSFQMQ